MVVLITGKQGAGKTHYAHELQTELEIDKYKVKHLDGDVLRAETENKDFSEEGRKKNLMKAAKLAAEYEDSGYIVLMSFIMPTKRLRNMMREQFEASRIVYLPGGKLWPGTIYERPTEKEMKVKFKYKKRIGIGPAIF